MATSKITKPCEPCEPLREPFLHNGSHAKTLKSLNNISHVNHVNGLYVRVRVNNISFIYTLFIKTLKNEIFLTREKFKKSFTSFTFLKNNNKLLIINDFLCEPFLINHSQCVHIIHISKGE